MLDTAPDPDVDPAFTPASLSLKPGTTGTVSLDLSDRRSTTARTMT